VFFTALCYTFFVLDEIRCIGEKKKGEKENVETQLKAERNLRGATPFYVKCFSVQQRWIHFAGGTT